jgi:hypothetical protein
MLLKTIKVVIARKALLVRIANRRVELRRIPTIKQLKIQRRISNLIMTPSQIGVGKKHQKSRKGLKLILMTIKRAF